jgi:hypothetical protein
LHGQFVEEAEDILEERIKYAKAHGQNHLHVYVGPYPRNHCFTIPWSPSVGGLPCA